MYDAWDYGPGNFSAGQVSTLRAGGNPYGGSSWADGLFNLAGAYLQFDAQKDIARTQLELQQAQDGRRYIEGQPVVLNQGGISPGVLLLAAVGVFAFLAVKG